MSDAALEHPPEQLAAGGWRVQLTAWAGGGYAAALSRMVDPVRFPALSQVIAAGVFGPGGPDQDGGVLEDDSHDDFAAEFEFALTCYFDGVAGFIARRTAG